MKILFIGGTGATGSRVVKKLSVAKIETTILSRKSHSGNFLVGNIKDPNVFNNKENDFNKVIICLGTRSFYGYNGIEEMELKGIQNLCQMIKKSSSIDQVILQSAFGIGRKSWGLSLFNKVLNNYFYFKEQIEKTIIETGKTFTIVRPVELLSDIQTGQIVLNQEQPLSLLRWVNREDVAEALFQASQIESAKNKIFEISGSLKPKTSFNWETKFKNLKTGMQLSPGSTPLC